MLHEMCNTSIEALLVTCAALYAQGTIRNRGDPLLDGILQAAICFADYHSGNLLLSIRRNPYHVFCKESHSKLLADFVLSEIIYLVGLVVNQHLIAI